MKELAVVLIWALYLVGLALVGHTGSLEATVSAFVFGMIPAVLATYAIISIKK